MKTLILYDSFFGNTEQVARAMGDAIGVQSDVQIIKIDQAGLQQLEGVDTLIVGSPTRAFRPSPDTSAFLKSIPDNGLSGTRVAAFDTRVSLEDTGSAILKLFVKLFGYAAKPIARTLKKKGGSPAAAPEGFIVQGKEGPLKEGELERAKAWAREAATT